MGWGSKVASMNSAGRCLLPAGYRLFRRSDVSSPYRSPLLNGKGSSSKHRPDCFGQFQVRADLGTGRFGPVYLGRDPSTSSRVVIRTFELSQEWREFGEQSDLLNAFQKLCEMTLDHPGLARPLAFGAEDDIPYLVYSHLAGTAMDAVMGQDGARPVEEVLQHTRQLADAIDFAANAGVHHGMMAPGDVILDRERTGVTGFGLAQALIKAGIPAEAEPPYGSPQRLSGAPPMLVDEIYSLAAITLELLIGTHSDQDQETGRALREAQGLPERRRIQRPAAHETRLFTMIAGADAGKLRACFASAFSEEPSERPSTASEFVASFQRAFSNRGETDKPAPSVVTVPFVSDEREDPPSAPVLNMKSGEDDARAEDEALLELPSRQERVVAKRPETLAMNQPLIRESHKRKHKHKQRQRTPASRVARPAPIVGDALVAEVTPPRASSIDEGSYGTPAQSASRPLLVAWLVAASLAVGFGGGFIVGRQSRPSIESINISHDESVAEPQPTRAAGEDPKAIVPTTPTVAQISNEQASSSKPIAATGASQPAVPAVDSGRLLIRSTPAGASVMVDGQSRGVTPLELRDLAFGAHTVRVSYPAHDTRERRVTFTERRPARSVDFELRPTSAPAHAAAATNAPGSLQVTSRPAGAQVFLDNNLIGTTPLLLSDVAVGSRQVRLELSGYKIFTTSVQIEPGARSRVASRLEP
jgi:serine/threonine protein kinase